MVGSASTKRRRTRSEDSSSSVGDSKKLRKSQQQSGSSGSKRKRRGRPGTSSSGDEAVARSPSRRKQPSRSEASKRSGSSSRGPSPAVSPRPKRTTSSTRRGPSPAMSPHPAPSVGGGRARNLPAPQRNSSTLLTKLVTTIEEVTLEDALVSVQPSGSEPPDDGSLQSPPKPSLVIGPSSPSLAESSPSKLRDVIYPRQLTSPSDTTAAILADIDPSYSARIATISKRPEREAFQTRDGPLQMKKTDHHKMKVAVWWAKQIALILVLSLAFLSLVIVSWKLYLNVHQQRSQMDSLIANDYQSNDNVELLLKQLETGNKEMDKLDRRQEIVSDGVRALESHLIGYVGQLEALEGEIGKHASSFKMEVEAGGEVTQRFLKETKAIEDEVRANLQMVTDESILNSCDEYLKELEVVGETLLQPASEDVEALTKRLLDMEAIASTNKERLLHLGGTLEGLYNVLEKKGTLQNLNSWLIRARDVQKIASRIEAERAHSLVAKVIEEMTSWALNAIVEEKEYNGSNTNMKPSSKEDIEERIAELLDNSLGGGMSEGDGVYMAARRLGGSILYHPLCTSPDYAIPTNLLPLVQRVLRKLRISGRSVAKPPETAISESNRLGDCWAFAGDKGRLTIKLAVPVIVSSVSIEHVPGESNMNKATSAPKDFSVDGWVGNPLEPSSEPLRLIEGVQYNISLPMPTMQTFWIKDDKRSLNDHHVQYVTLNVESNHGNTDFTCIYQFHVHGSQKMWS